MPEWLVQAIIANWIWELLVIGTGIAIGWLRHKNVSWLPVLFYGFAGSVLMSVLIFTLLGRAILSRQQPEATPENVEKNIRAWSDAFQLGVTRLPADQTIEFGLVITAKSGNPIEIRKTKQTTYLQLQSNLVLSPEHKEMLAKLNPEQSEWITEQLSLELARSKIGFTILGPRARNEQPEMQIVVLSKGVPIYGLTEMRFAEYLDEMDSAIKLSKTTTALMFDHGPLHDLMTKQHSIAVQ